MLRDWKLDIVCLQETKLQIMSCNIVRSLWGWSHVDWCCLGAYTLAVSFRLCLGAYILAESCLVMLSSGPTGGILIMWDTRVVEKVDVCVGAYTLAVSFRNVVDLSIWAFARVYGLNLDRDRRLLWEELVGVLSRWNIPWCIEGDFNVTWFPSELSGGARLDFAMMEFSDFISEQGLMDLPLVEGSYTWSISNDRPL
jgi:hypothetical protein